MAPRSTPLRSQSVAFPRDTEEGRAFLQVRLALMAKVGFLVTVGIDIVSVLVFANLPVDSSLGWRSPGHFAQLVSAAFFGIAYLAVREKPRTPAALAWLDVLASVPPALTYLWVGFLLPTYLRPELIELFGISHVLILRAVLIPSSASRTLAISSVVLLPLPAFTYAYYVTTPLGPGMPPPIAYAAVTSFLLTVPLFIGTLVSHTIYGLQKQVREATQLGQYTLGEKIGEGGMGIVYKASHSMLRRPTAVKLLPAEKAGEQNLHRFEREVQLTSMLTHPNTVAIYDFGRTQDGIFYYAMEYLEGIDLEDLVVHDGPQSAPRVIHLLQQVAGALEEAHGVGLIHRDIKPANIILCERGGIPDVAKVVDFGLVKMVGPAGDGMQSSVHDMAGTPLFLSPEAIVTPSTIDHRSDLYAVGAVGYYLLTGKHVFEGRTLVEICGHHLHSVPPPPSQRVPSPVPADLEAVVLACLAKSPDDRPKDARALGAALLACRDAGAFSADDALAWWRDRGKAIRARVAAAASRPLATTEQEPRAMTVDLAQRRAGAVKTLGVAPVRSPAAPSVDTAPGD